MSRSSRKTEARSYVASAISITLLRMSRPQQGDDFIVCDLWKVRIELADGLEVLRGFQADHLIGEFCYFLQRVRRRYRYSTDQLRRVPGSQTLKGRNHGRTRGKAIIHHDDNAPGGVNRWAHRRVLGASLANGLQLPLFLSSNVLLAGAVSACVVGYVGPAAFINGSNCEFRLVRCAQFAHQNYVELTIQLTGNDFAHGYRPARYRDDQRVLAPVVLELSNQSEGRFISIVEHVKWTRVGNIPIIHATPQISLRFIKAVCHCHKASCTQEHRIDGVVITFVNGQRSQDA